MKATVASFKSPKGTECWLTMPDSALTSVFYIDGLEHARFQVVMRDGKEGWLDREGTFIEPEKLGALLACLAQVADDAKVPRGN
jgi:hypothetical protein